MVRVGHVRWPFREVTLTAPTPQCQGISMSRSQPSPGCRRRLIQGRVPRVRAVIIHRRGGPEVLTAVSDHPRPELRRPDEVLVRVLAASVNPLDTLLRKGLLPMPLRFPHVPGCDACGIVEAVGPAVSRFQPGDAVFGLRGQYALRGGCYAEYVTFQERHLARAPNNLTPVEAASLPLVGLTAWQALVETARLTAGQRVLITGGSGGVGSFAVQLAKALGATVYTTCGPTNVQLCRQLGADEVFDYTAGDFSSRPELAGLDVVFDTVGGYYRQGLRVLRRRGWFIGITVLLSDKPHMTLGNLRQHLGRRVAGQVLVPWGHPQVRTLHVRANGHQLERIRELVERGSLKPLLAATYPLEQVQQAHALSETRRARGKIVLTLE